jgi:hypothetical protein
MYYGGMLFLLLRASHLHLSDGAFVLATGGLTLRLITSRVRDAATSPNDELTEIIINLDR